MTQKCVFIFQDVFYSEFEPEFHNEELEGNNNNNNNKLFREIFIRKNGEKEHFLELPFGLIKGLLLALQCRGKNFISCFHYELA